MHRIDTPEAIDGQFSETTNPATRVSADWANDIQENVAQAIEAAGIALEKGAGGQLAAAIMALARAHGAPTGTVIMIDGPTAPAGYLAMDGEEYDRDDFPALVAFYEAQSRLIAGTTEDTFRVPDYRGQFGRAWSEDASVDPDGPRAPGDFKLDTIRSHNHTLPVNADNDTGNGFVEDAAGSGAARVATTGYTGGLETRPKSVALLWCVKT